MSARHLAELHAFLVHFPIALLLASVALDFAAVIFRRASLVEGATWALLLGAPGAAAAILSGWLSERQTNVSAAVNLLHWHKVAALLTTAVFGTMFLARLLWLSPQFLAWLRLAFPAGKWLASMHAWARAKLPVAYGKHMPRWVVTLYLLAGIIGVALLGITDILGEKMVYGYSIGLPLR